MGSAWEIGGLILTGLSAHAADPPLSLERTIPLKGVSGRIDHMAFDLGRKRLIVAELGNNTVDVIDIVAGTSVHRISGLREPQGIGYAQRADVILIANAGDGSVRLLKAADFSPAGSIALGDDADNIRIDPRNGNAVIGYGSGGLAVVDPASATKLADIRLPAHPEGFQIDPKTGQTYVNIPDAHQIAVVDLDARRVVANWPTGTARSNFPMALDASQSLVAACSAHRQGYCCWMPLRARSDREFQDVVMRTIYSSTCGACASMSAVAPATWR